VPLARNRIVRLITHTDSAAQVTGVLPSSRKVSWPQMHLGVHAVCRFLGRGWAQVHRVFRFCFAKSRTGKIGKVGACAASEFAGEVAMSLGIRRFARSQTQFQEETREP
jgi:hypothetical protein